MNEDKSLNDKILSWIRQQGFPLEMRVASKLRNAGLRVRQSWHYLDLETDKSREIDILCTAQDTLGMAEIHFAIECKSTKHPWLLFSSDDTTSNYSRIFAFGIFSEHAHRAIADKFFPYLNDNEKIKKGIEKAKKFPWFWKDRRIGYGMTQSFVNSMELEIYAFNRFHMGSCFLHRK